MGAQGGASGGAAGVRVWLWLGVHWGRIGGVAMGVAGGLRGCRSGADVVRMTVPVSFWGLDGTEVLCFRRWEEV